MTDSTSGAAADAAGPAGDRSVAADPAPAAMDPVIGPAGAVPGEAADDRPGTQDDRPGTQDGTDADSRGPALLLGAIAVVLGAVVLVDAARIHAPAGQSFVGPAAFPVGVGILLIVTGAALAGTRAVAVIRAARTRPARTSPAHTSPAHTSPERTSSERTGPERTSPERTSRAGMRSIGRVAALLGLLIGYAVLLPRLSYVLSTAALFSGAALLFGSGHRLRTVVIGIVLAAVTFVGFSRGIGVSLPAGPWGF